MVETRVYQISLTPKPLSVTPRQFISGKKVPEAVVKRERQGFVGTGSPGRGKMLDEERRMGDREAAGPQR